MFVSKRADILLLLARLRNVLRQRLLPVNLTLFKQNIG